MPGGARAAWAARPARGVAAAGAAVVLALVLAGPGAAPASGVDGASATGAVRDPVRAAGAGRIEAQSVDGAVVLREAGRPVLEYRWRPRAGAEAWRLHYVHPLHAGSGLVLTEDGPADHVHQRGVYWAWRRMLLDGRPAGDGWVGKDLSWSVAEPRVERAARGAVTLHTAARWVGMPDGAPLPLVEERTRIRVEPARGGTRRLAFEIRLRALRPGVALAGTDDDKGYGGFSVRFARSPDLRFASNGRELRAAVGAVATGDAVELRWAGAPPGWPARVTLSCRAEGRAWRAWVLRQEASMQNCAYPGRAPRRVPVDRDLVIEATLELHDAR